MSDTIDPDTLKRLFPNASQSTIKRNVPVEPLAGVCPQKPQSNERSQSQDPRMEEGQPCIRYRITITVYRKRLLDQGDNDRYATKPLRDCIATYLGFSNDNDECLEWDYHQVKSRSQGVHVLITNLPAE